MFSRIAPRYDLLNRLLSGGTDVAWRNEAARLLAPAPGETGPRPLLGHRRPRPRDPPARPAARARVVAADFTFEMLALGKEKFRRRGAAIPEAGADGLRLPFPDGTFDGADRGLRGEELRGPRPRACVSSTASSGPAGASSSSSSPRSRPGRSPPSSASTSKRVVPLLGRLVSRDGSAYQYLPDSVGPVARARRPSRRGCAPPASPPSTSSLLAFGIAAAPRRAERSPMTATILDGAKVAAEIRRETAEAVAALVRAARSPGLAVDPRGGRPREPGLRPEQGEGRPGGGDPGRDAPLPRDRHRGDAPRRDRAPQRATTRSTRSSSSSPSRAGIGTSRVLEAIDPAKDVDGFHPVNVGRLVQGKARSRPLHPGRRHGAPPAGGRAASGSARGRPRPQRHRRQADGDAPDARRRDRHRRPLEDPRPPRPLPRGRPPRRRDRPRRPSSRPTSSARGRSSSTSGSTGSTRPRGRPLLPRRRGEGRGVRGEGVAPRRRRPPGRREGAARRATRPVPGGVGPLTIARLLANTVDLCRARRAPLTVLRVGLTGGIASGKSAVAARWRELGIPVLDADRVVHALYEPGAAGRRRRGRGVRHGAPRRVAAPSTAPRLAAPRLRRPRRRRTPQRPRPPARPDRDRPLARPRRRPKAHAVAVVEATLLVENDGRDRFDLLVAVSAPEELRLARAARPRSVRHPRVRPRPDARPAPRGGAATPPATS